MLPSTLSSIVLLITKALDAEGIDSTQVLIRAGLNPTQLSDPNARYSYPAVTHLWKMAAKVSGDPCFGFKAASYWHPTTLHALVTPGWQATLLAMPYNVQPVIFESLIPP